VAEAQLKAHGLAQDGRAANMGGHVEVIQAATLGSPTGSLTIGSAPYDRKRIWRTSDRAHGGSVMPMRDKNNVTDVVSRTSVIRGASVIVGGITVLCWLATALSGTPFIHPLLSTILLIGSIVFYAISRTDK
jgi:hypothetical protein